MAYVLRAVIGRSAVIRAGLPGWPLVDLKQGFAMVPLRDDDPQPPIGEWLTLTFDLEETIVRASLFGPLVYVEADIHGGTGRQSAAGWSDRTLQFGPVHTESGPGGITEEGADEPVDEMAIDRGLRWLGVQRRGMQADADEFAALGLDRHRWPADWLAAAQ